MAELDLGNLAFTWQGAYSASTTYERDDIVEYNGSSYVYINATSSAGNLPTSTTHWELLAQGFTFPAGTVSYVAASTAPSGWLKANGALISRAAYAPLFNVIGTTFGAGDGSTTFALPDLRGEFLRSWDDGRGVDTGRVLGDAQGDTIRNITGQVSPNWISSSPNELGGALQSVANTNRYTYSSGPYWGSSLNFDASRVVPTSNENRPRNISLLACIKY